MATIDQKYVIREDVWKGYNDRLAPEFLTKGFVADAQNVLFTTGEIVKRTGYTLIANDLALSQQCQGMKGVQFADGTKEIYAVFAGGVYKWTGSGNWTSLGGTLSSTAQVEIVMANNAVYFFDGVNTVVKYPQGGPITTVAAIPIGKYARWFHNQMHVAGISGTPNTLQSSTIGDPETFTGGTSSTLAVNPNDGDYITGLNTFKDNLIVSKIARFWAASGFGTSTLTLSNISEIATNLGTMSNRSMVNIGNELLYLSFYGGIPHFRSISRTIYGTLIDNGIISNDITSTMNGLNTVQLTKCAGLFDGRLVYWAIANGSSSTNNLVLVFDTVTRAWTKFVGINASCWDSFTISTKPQIYFGEATASSKAYIFSTSTSDNGTAIASSITTKRYGADEAEHKNKYKWLHVRAKEVGNYNVTIDYAVDGFTYNNLGTLNLTGTGSIFDGIVLDVSRLGTTDVKRKRFSIPKSRNYYIQFKMYETSATSSVTIRNWELTFEKRKVFGNS